VKNACCSASDILRGAAAGALGGALGSTTMVLFNRLLGAAGFAPDDLGRHDAHHRLDAKPNDSDATISDEPATRKAASWTSAFLTGQPLDEAGKDVGGPILHHAFGACLGALYGAAAAGVPGLASGGGIPFGATVWLTAAETGMPMAGLSRGPTAYPPERHIASLLSHLVYGATVEAVCRTVRTR
jgi:putative membrane protein